jgi:drug/metabolite transporter, DME family
MEGKSGHRAWMILAAGVLWGTTGTAQALAPSGAQPLTVGALRLAIGGLTLLGLALGRRAFVGGGKWPLRSTIAAAVLTALYQLTFFAAVARTGVAVGTIVGIGSAPVVGGILGRLLHGEVLTRRWLVATILAVAGCTLLALSGGGTVRIDPLGIVLALGAGASYAGYTLAVKNLLPGRSPDAVMAVVFCLGALLLSPFLFSGELSWLLQPRGLAVALHLGVFATALSYWFFARGLSTVPVSTAVTLSLAEPLTAALLGVTLLNEQLTLIALGGIVLIFSGLVVLVWKGQRRGHGTA